MPINPYFRPFLNPNPSTSFDSRRKFQVDFPDPEMEQDLAPPSYRDAIDFSKFYEAPGPASQAYSTYLGKVPDVQDYAPTKWRRLGAILSGLSSGMGGGNAYETARDINLDPYKQAYSRWAEGGQGLKESATLEETAARNRSTFLQKVLSDYMDQQYKQEQLGISRGQLDVSRGNLDVNRERAGISGRLADSTISYNTARTADIPNQNRYRNKMADSAAISAGAAASNAATNRRGVELRESPTSPENIFRMLGGFGNILNATKSNWTTNSAQDIESMATKRLIARYYSDDLFDKDTGQLSQRAVIGLINAHSPEYQQIMNELRAQFTK